MANLYESPEHGGSEQPRRSRFKPGRRTILAAVAGAGVGVAVLYLVINEPSLNPWLSHVLVGPSPGLGFLMFELTSRVVWAVSTMRVATVVTFAAYGGLLSRRPRWQTAVLLLIFHITTGLIVGWLLSGVEPRGEIILPFD